MSPETPSVWTGIDPEAAEARLRNITRKLMDTDAALQAQRRALSHNPQSFAFQLSCDSLEHMRERLLEDRLSVLRHRVREPITVALDGRRFRSGAASIGHLGVFFLRLQKLYSSVAQAIRSGPTLTGPIPGEVRAATDLLLAGVFPSSFGMTMMVPTQSDLTGRSLAADSLTALFGLLAPSDDERGLMQLSGELGPRTLSHLRQLARDLSKNEVDLRLEWANYSGRTFTVVVTSSRANSILSLLENILQNSSTERILHGFLLGASLLRDRFEFLADDIGLIEGTIVSGLGEDVTAAFGKRCSVTVNETEVLNRASGERRFYYVLTSINGHRPAAIAHQAVS